MSELRLIKQVLLSFGEKCTEHREDLSSVYLTPTIFPKDWSKLLVLDKLEYIVRKQYNVFG